MRADTFTESSPGALVLIPEGVHAFVPDSLPPRIEFDAGLMKAYGAAREAVGQLRVAIPHFEINPYLIANPLLRREAFYSSQIEGTYTTPKEMALFEMEDDEASMAQFSPETREVVNYIRAMEHGLDLIGSHGLPVCHRVIKEIHARLMTGVRGTDKHPGEYRERQNFIGRQIDGFEGARFVPPPPDVVETAMDDLEKYLNLAVGDERPLPLLIDLALIHYQFEAIHPFLDGNGRIGRLLIPILLCAHGRMRTPLLYASAFFERNKDEYNDLLLRISTHGGWPAWIAFFLRALEESAKESVSKAQALWRLREKYIDAVRMPRSSALLTTLVERLFTRPSITFNQAAELLNVTHPQAAAHIRTLERQGVLTEQTGGRRNLRFVAEEILACVFD